MWRSGCQRRAAGRRDRRGLTFWESGWGREWSASRSGGESGADGGESGEGSVDVLEGGVGAEGEADDFGGFGSGLVHGKEHVRGLNGTDHAGGSGGGCDAFEVEAHEHVFGGDPRETDVGGVGEAACVQAIDGATGPDAGEGAFEVVAQAGETFGFAVGEFCEGEGCGLGHGGDGGGVFGAGSTAIFLSAPVQAGGQGETAFEVEKSHPFGSVELVCGGGDGVEGSKVHGHFAQGLYGVSVEKDSALAAGARDLFDGLDDAGFVVGGHE